MPPATAASGIPHEPALTLVDHHLRLAVPAEENGTPFQPVGMVLEIGKIGVADYELILGSGDQGILLIHKNSFFEQK